MDATSFSQFTAGQLDLLRASFSTKLRLLEIPSVGLHAFPFVNAALGKSISASSSSLSRTAIEAKSSLSSSSNDTIPTTTPLIITTSGVTTLTADILFAPSVGNTAAIIISADNVILDLAGHTVRTKSSKIIPGTVGILVNGHVHIRIQNGTICGFSQYGVSANLCSDVHYNNLSVSNIGQRVGFPSSAVGAGLSASLCSNVVISGCRVRKVVISTGSLNAIFASGCTTVSITDCVSEQHTNLGGPTAGIQCILSTGITISRCRVRYLRTRSENESFGSHTIGGIYLAICSSASIDNCSIRHLSSECDDCHGIPAFLCPTSVTISDCTVYDVRDGFNQSTGTGAKATGYEIDGTNNCTVTRCVADRIIARNPEDKQCAAFSNGLCTNVQFIDCVAKNVSCIGEGIGYGFGWSPDPRPAFIGTATNTVCQNCVAEKCDVGFSLFNQINGQYLRCKAIRNRLYGFFNGGDLTISCHPCTECNPPITTTIVNQSAGNAVTCAIIRCSGISAIRDIRPGAGNTYTERCK